MSNISSMVQMLFRYAIFIIIIIILLIIGLMFFYFTNQITYQNNKINTMFGIVTELVQKDIQPINIPFPSMSDPTQSMFQIPGSSCNLIEVSDSDDDSDDDDDDDEHEDDDEIPQINFTSPVDINEDTINIQLLDITDVTEVNNNDKAVGEECITVDMDMEIDFKPDDKPVVDNNSSEDIVEDGQVDELNITIIHSEPKHSGGNSSNHHKSLHVNELRKMAIQLHLIPQVEAKKLKKDELVDLLSKSAEAKQD
jgi:hypothetical protein